MKLKYGLSAIVGIYLIYKIFVEGLTLMNGFIFLLFLASLLGEFARNRHSESCKQRIKKEGYVDMLRNDIKRELDDEERKERHNRAKEEYIAKAAEAKAKMAQENQN